VADVYRETFSSASSHFKHESFSLYGETVDDSGPDDDHYSGGDSGDINIDDLFNDL